MNTANTMPLAMVLLTLLALFFVSVMLFVKQRRADTTSASKAEDYDLTETIQVNLNILKGEIVELRQLESATAPALALVGHAEREAEEITRLLPNCPASQMVDLLARTFRAMDQTTRARALLKITKA
ncbi:MAG: hypothetical protein LCH63_19930 [Candidatus Melainabacteria bacterium]|nr:hypothetical protein [Candidatus Melainabacteria bacterium]